MAKYFCKTRCWVAGKKKAMFEPGDIVSFDTDEQVPSHFSLIEELKKEELKIEVKKEEEVIVEDKKEMVETLIDTFEEVRKEVPKLRKPTLSKE